MNRNKQEIFIENKSGERIKTKGRVSNIRDHASEINFCNKIGEIKHNGEMLNVYYSDLSKKWIGIE